MGWLEYGILALVALWLGIVLYLRRRRGASSCGGCCTSCPHSCKQKKA